MAVRRTEELYATLRQRVGTHSLHRSYACHLLVHGVPINYMLRWLDHSSIRATLVYLDQVPDPTGSLASCLRAGCRVTDQPTAFLQPHTRPSRHWGRLHQHLTRWVQLLR